MSRIEQLKSEVLAHWAGQPAAELCTKILDYVVNLLPDQAEMLTFSNLCRAAGKDRPDDEFMTALTILVSSKIDALDARVLFIDEAQHEHEIEPEVLEHARAHGELPHPITGQLVEDFEAHLIPFFVPSPKLREAASR